MRAVFTTYSNQIRDHRIRGNRSHDLYRRISVPRRCLPRQHPVLCCRISGSGHRDRTDCCHSAGHPHAHPEKISSMLSVKARRVAKGCDQFSFICLSLYLSTCNLGIPLTRPHKPQTSGLVGTRSSIYGASSNSKRESVKARAGAKDFESNDLATKLFHYRMAEKLCSRVFQYYNPFRRHSLTIYGTNCFGSTSSVVVKTQFSQNLLATKSFSKLCCKEHKVSFLLNGE